MVKRLRSEGYWVRGVDIKYPDFTMSAADEFIIGDLREVGLVARVLDIHEDSFDEIYQFAADMGGVDISSQMNTLLISCTTLLQSILMY